MDTQLVVAVFEVESIGFGRRQSEAVAEVVHQIDGAVIGRGFAEGCL